MYKLENGNLIKAPNAVRRTINGKDYITTNPTTDILAELGYKPLVEEGKPELGENEACRAVLTEPEDKIVKSWDVYEVEEAEG